MESACKNELHVRILLEELQIKYDNFKIIIIYEM
jgi:hypothetical protein